jgi:hypothetical protein
MREVEVSLPQLFLALPSSPISGTQALPSNLIEISSEVFLAQSAHSTNVPCVRRHAEYKLRHRLDLSIKPVFRIKATRKKEEKKAVVICDEASSYFLQRF